MRIAGTLIVGLATAAILVLWSANAIADPAGPLPPLESPMPTATQAPAPAVGGQQQVPATGQLPSTSTSR